MGTLPAQLREVREQYGRHLRAWAVSVLLFPACLYFCSHRGFYTLLDDADLIIHEAGHVFFAILGHDFHIMGGTLMQIVLPLVLAGSFYRHSYRTGVQVSLFWLGHNLINISVYAADARAQRLPLLGGDHVLHDWHTMLGGVGLLDSATAVGNSFFVLAVIAFGMAVLMPALMWEGVAE
ncbi:MAG TPA: hypothetical protein VFG50_06370 [Rhodothermales bacterium]|nr:hypothetical protein [Rhodothermales bacterium]